MDLPRYNAASLDLVAQLVEQRIENPRVGGSIPPQATKKFKQIAPAKIRGFCFSDTVSDSLIGAWLRFVAPQCLAMRSARAVLPSRIGSV